MLGSGRPFVLELRMPRKREIDLVQMEKKINEENEGRIGVNNLKFVGMKNKQAITLLFLSNIISGLAQGISMIAIPWYFIEIIDQPKFFAYSYIVITLITLFWGIYAGSLIDRYSRKKIFIITNLICGLFIGSIALYGFYNEFLFFRFNNVI